MYRLKHLLLGILLLQLISPSPLIAAEWPQDAGNAQRTGFTPEEPTTPWSFVWSFNGPDSNGGTGGHIYNAPKEARTVTGDGRIYIPAGSNGLYALSLANGANLWRATQTNFNATPAFAGGFVYVGGQNGTLYKLSASNGNTAASFNAGSPINKSILLVNNYVYFTTENGKLYKLDTASLNQVWVYSANSNTATPPAYSASRDAIIFATQDLFVHAVNNTNGSQKWRTKPSPSTAGFPYQFDGMWPVIADTHGIAFVRMRIHHNALWEFPANLNKYPDTNSETRNFLTANPRLKNLFALNLDNGSESFIPAVGYGGVEGLVNGSPYMDTGPVPVIKTVDNKEVAYMLFRNGQGVTTDGRWDSHLGEMVLDNNTISGLAAGDLRFVNFPNSQVTITDEQTPLTMAGETIFNSHWGAVSATKITSRGASLGLTKSNPIQSSPHPVIIRRISSCGDFKPQTHYTTCGLNLFQDGRYWNGPGFWVYWNVIDPPGPIASGAYSAGLLPRYTYVSNGYIVVEGNGGDIFVLKHSGTTSATAIPTNTPAATPTPKPGDTDGRGVVDGQDYVVWLNNFGKRNVPGGSTIGDFNNDKNVDGIDYSIWLNNYGR